MQQKNFFKFINRLFRKINWACNGLTSIYKTWKGLRKGLAHYIWNMEKLRKGLAHYFNNRLKVNEISFVTEASVKKYWILNILANLYTKTSVSGEWIKVTFPWSDLVFFLLCSSELNLLSIFTDKMNAFFFWSTIDVPILQHQSIFVFCHSQSNNLLSCSLLLPWLKKDFLSQETWVCDPWMRKFEIFQSFDWSFLLCISNKVFPVAFGRSSKPFQESWCWGSR